MGAVQYVLMPFTDDLPDKLFDLSLALEHGIDAALGKFPHPYDREEVMEKLIAAAGYEIEERDEQ